MHGRLNVNVALNRPTFMSSVYHDPNHGGDFPSSRANDGNKDPTALQVDNSCAVTNVDVNAWWAVDLGAALAVVGVLFTNRDDNCCGSYLRYVPCLYYLIIIFLLLALQTVLLDQKLISCRNSCDLS